MQNIFTAHLRSLSCRIPTSFCRNFCDFNFKHNFSEEEVRKILHVINTKTPEELSRYSIAKSRLQRITGWKQQHGQFSSLSELLELDDFGVKILDKFCHSIVKNDGKTGESAEAVKKSPQILTPKLTEDKRGSIRSCCSVQVGIDSVSWCRLELSDEETPSIVTHWQFFSLNSKKSHLSDLTQMILHVNQLIPSSDAFVLETPVPRQASPAVNATQIAVNVRQSQVIAMMTVILALRKQDFHDSVFFVRNYLPARLFGTLVGQERTSSLDVVSRLMQEANQETEGAAKGRIRVDPDILIKYKTVDGVEKEYLGRCLMLGVCFLRLCILKCSVSLSKVNRRGK